MPRKRANPRCRPRHSRPLFPLSSAAAPEPAADPAFGGGFIVGRCQALLNAIRLAERAAAHDTPVLLCGPAGTGKELLARAIHEAGPAGDEPFVAVDCGAMPAPLLGAELFGQGAEARRRGLLELAGRGTVFLAEIGRLPGELQPKLLRILEERRLRSSGSVAEVTIHCRVIAAANTPLEDAVARGELRADLHSRLAMVAVHLPPLRARGGDLELLADAFLRRLALERGSTPKTLTPQAVSALRRHPWPGNVRELRIAVERAAIVTEGPTIGLEDLTFQHRFSRSAASPDEELAAEIRIPPTGKSLEQIEREAIALTLPLVGGNQSAAARLLGISRPTLARKLARYGLRAD